MARWSFLNGWRRSGRLVALGLALGTVIGCGSGNTYPVHGKVVYKDGKPLPGGLVVFAPVDGHLQVTARGDIQENGTFTLETYKEHDGAVPGKYRVAVTPPPPRKVREKPVEPALIHRRFQNYETSGIEFEVAKRKNEFTVVVEKP